MNLHELAVGVTASDGSRTLDIRVGALNEASETIDVVSIGVRVDDEESGEQHVVETLTGASTQMLPGRSASFSLNDTLDPGTQDPEAQDIRLVWEWDDEELADCDAPDVSPAGVSESATTTVPPPPEVETFAIGETAVFALI